jgi:hypothetical protein
MIKLEGKYKFPNFKTLEFYNPQVSVENKVLEVNPETMTINVSTWVEIADNFVRGRFYVDINPVPVKNLHYNGGELIQRVTERLNDFKI